MSEPEDIRVETLGHWTQGMTIRDGRRKRRATGAVEKEIIGDDLGWLSSVRGIGFNGRRRRLDQRHSTRPS
jgi:hypothetical protein